MVGKARDLGARRIEWESDPNAAGFYLRMGARKFKEQVSELDRTVPWMEFAIDGVRTT